MEFRDYFNKNTWWGKLIGAFFGFLIFGPIGALFGLFIGNFFDRGLLEHFSKPFWHYHAERNANIKQVFFESMFLMLGHLAKADGRVTEEAITFTKNLFQQMELDLNQQDTAQQLFNQGKEKKYNELSTLSRVQKVMGKNPNLVRLFIETQYQFIRYTGLTEKKLNIMNRLLVNLKLAPLYRQPHFADEFWQYSRTQNQEHQARQSSYQQQSSSSYHHYRPKPQGYIDEAYITLGLKPNASQQEVKQAYRRLISKNHPDKLIAKGLPEPAIKAANEKTQKIRKAYEHICEMRGW